MSKFKNDIILTIILLSIAMAILFFTYVAPELKYYNLLSIFGLAIIIVVIGRWIVLLFSNEEKESMTFSSSRTEYTEAIKNATRSIDVLQTWFPERQIFTELLLKKRTLDLRILLSSVQEVSPIIIE